MRNVVRRLAARVDAVVVSSGNQGKNIEDFATSGAAGNDIIFAIAAHDENGNEYGNSNTGELVKITAP